MLKMAATLTISFVTTRHNGLEGADLRDILCKNLSFRMVSKGEMGRHVSTLYKVTFPFTYKFRSRKWVRK
jgi:hypothetical protein